MSRDTEGLRCGNVLAKYLKYYSFCLARGLAELRSYVEQRAHEYSVDPVGGGGFSLADSWIAFRRLPGEIICLARGDPRMARGGHVAVSSN